MSINAGAVIMNSKDQYQLIKRGDDMYNSIMTASILLIAAYELYHYQPPIDDNIAWTAPATQA